MKNIIFFIAVSGVISVSAFAAESIGIEGVILNSKKCAPLKIVKGVLLSSSKKIVVCAGDFRTADFTNGATKSALTDGKTYYIMGELHEGALSVNEVAARSE